MPFGSEGLQPGVALALSGGEFRATLFHCGALWRLKEFGYLQKRNRVSSVSGGSITTGLLALKWSRLQWTNDVATNFGQEIVAPLRAFCTLSIDAPAIGQGALLPWRDGRREFHHEVHEVCEGQEEWLARRGQIRPKGEAQCGGLCFQ